MDTDKIRALLYALNKGNLTEAAEDLGYTTSGLSRMMMALEAETGFTLLHRSRTGIEPTGECRMMMPTMKELVRLDDLYHERAADILGIHTGTVRVGVAYAYYLKYINDAIREFSESYPGITVEILDDFSTPLVRKVERHELDLAVVTRRETNLRWDLLKMDPVVVWVPEDYDRCDEVYPLKNLETDPFVSIFPGQDSDNLRVFSKLGIRPNVRYTAQTTLIGFEMVGAGLGVATTNGLFAEGWQGKVRILKTDPAVHFPIGLVSPKDEDISPAARKFREILLKHLPSEDDREPEKTEEGFVYVG